MNRTACRASSPVFSFAVSLVAWHPISGPGLFVCNRGSFDEYVVRITYTREAGRKVCMYGGMYICTGEWGK